MKVAKTSQVISGGEVSTQVKGTPQTALQKPKPDDFDSSAPATPASPELKSGGAAAANPLERAQALVRRLKAGAAVLGPGPGLDEFQSDLGLAARTLEKSNAAFAYGKLGQVLDQLKSAFYSLDDNRLRLPDELTGDIQRGFMETFSDYLAEVGVALEGWLDAAVKAPSARTFDLLEERTRYAASAAAGSGKAENEVFGRLADKLYAVTPELAGTIKGARAKLALRAEEVRQTRLDMIGVNNGGLSVAERARLIIFDPTTLNNGELTRRLDAAEEAAAKGAGGVAGAVLSEVSQAIWTLGLQLPPFGEPTDDEAEFARRRDRAPNPSPPLSLAEYRAAKARTEAMRPGIWAASFDSSLKEAQLSFTKELEGTYSLGYTAASLSTSKNATPEQLTAAQRLLVGVTVRDLEARQKTADQVRDAVSASPLLHKEQDDLLYAFTRLPREFEKRPELGTVPDELLGDLRQKIQRYESTRAQLPALVEGRFDATRQALEREASIIEALPADQQLPKWKELYARTAPLQTLNLWLPDAVTGPAEKLTEAVYAKAFPSAAGKAAR